MMKKFLLLACIAVLSACVHEFPDSETSADVVINLHMDMTLEGQNFIQISKEDDPVSLQEYSDASVGVLYAEEYDSRSVIRFYRKGVDGEYDTSAHDYEFIIYDDDPMNETISAEVKVAEGSYAVYVWRDYVRDGEKESPYYDVDDFRAVTCKDEYVGSTDSRDAMYGSAQVEVIRYGKQYNENHYHITMERPFARIVIISNDLDEFMTKSQAKRRDLDLDDFEVRFVYRSDGLSDRFGTDKPTLYDLPTTYDVFKDAATGSRSNVGFTSSIVKLSAMEAQLGFDYVYSGQGMVYVAVAVYDKDGTQLAQTPSIAVPVARNQETVVNGSFLIENISGGAVIEPDFSGDHNYEIK